MSELALSIANATKVFAAEGPFLSRLRHRKERVVAVNNVSLQVRRGEIFGILGPNGSGKSTLVRLVATLLIPDTGKIFVFGHIDAAARQHLIYRLRDRGRSIALALP